MTRGDAYVVSGSEDGTIHFWDLVGGKEMHKLTGHEGRLFVCLGPFLQVVSGLTNRGRRRGVQSVLPPDRDLPPLHVRRRHSACSPLHWHWISLHWHWVVALAVVDSAVPCGCTRCALPLGEARQQHAD
eukprot:49431-Rhodomonas_salina.5